MMGKTMKIIIDPGDDDHDVGDNVDNFYDKRIRISSHFLLRCSLTQI
jgi:hypothetical protein